VEPLERGAHVVGGEGRRLPLLDLLAPLLARRANEALERLREANRTGDMIAAFIWAGRLDCARIVIEVYLRAWWAQGCREAAPVRIEFTAEEKASILAEIARTKAEPIGVIAVHGAKPGAVRGS
jgi:hypothetical protein